MSSGRGDTIAAIATPPGRGGIGIVRVSGPGALAIGAAVFRGRGGRSLADAAPATLVLGTVVDPPTGEALDEALAVVMPAGRSYTGEETIEIQGHGGPAVLEGILVAVLAAGARLAGPGEFTRRAHGNGRIDLAQAEAVAELIEAETAEERGAALRQLEGATSRSVGEIRDRVLDLAAALEARIEFGEAEGLEATPPAGDFEASASAIRALLRSAAQRRRAARGPRVVLLGRANTGKSSLFNYLYGSDRALVTARPGTTRDYIEERLTLGGSDVVLVDTAGIREKGDDVEALGIARSRALALSADLVLLVIDGSVPLRSEDAELAASLAGRPHMVVLTKADLPRVVDPDPILAGDGLEVFRTSVVTGEGCAGLAVAVGAHAQSGGAPPLARGPAPNARQGEALEGALVRIEAAGKLAATSAAIDLAAEELRSAIACLDAVLGHEAGEETLDRVFSRFCVGK